jgi:hypothetical protein
MRITRKGFTTLLKILWGGMLFSAITSVFGQVSPDEILNPRAKAAEEKYILQLQSIQRSIGAAHFPYSFRLARYLKAKPGQREALDSAGIEFVYYQNRVVLKVSGAYKTAFNAADLSRNQRASRAFQETVVPVLRLVAEQMPQVDDYDDIGFEVIYDIRDGSKSFDFEGKEVLTVVFSRDDAFRYGSTLANAERQNILNRSDIFVNGESFGLALGQREPYVVEALDRSALRHAKEGYSAAPSTASNLDKVTGASVSPAVSITKIATAPETSPTFGDAMRLQTQFQAQLDAIAREDGAKLHLAENAEPLFQIDGDQTVLHFTLRNTMGFDQSSTSIYKRTALSFDLFLAPELRDLTRRLPANEGYDTIEFSVLDHSEAEQASSEIIDYICPLTSLRSFVANKITTQDLINQSVVLVNGVRIAVNLQLVE